MSGAGFGFEFAGKCYTREFDTDVTEFTLKANVFYSWSIATGGLLWMIGVPVGTESSLLLDTARVEAKSRPHRKRTSLPFTV